MQGSPSKFAHDDQNRWEFPSKFDRRDNIATICSEYSSQKELSHRTCLGSKNCHKMGSQPSDLAYNKTSRSYERDISICMGSGVKILAGINEKSKNRRPNIFEQIFGTHRTISIMLS